MEFRSRWRLRRSSRTSNTNQNWWSRIRLRLVTMLNSTDHRMANLVSQGISFKGSIFHYRPFIIRTTCAQSIKYLDKITFCRLGPKILIACIWWLRQDTGLERDPSNQILDSNPIDDCTNINSPKCVFKL